MKLRLAIIPLLLALLAIPDAHAQRSGQGQAESADRLTQMLFKDITLTPAQKARVDSIMTHYRAQMVRSPDGRRPDSTAMASRRSFMQKQSADLRTVLVPEQQTVFDRNLEEMRTAMQRRQGANR